MTTRRDLIAGAGLMALAVGLGAGRAWGQAADTAAAPSIDEFYAPPSTADTALSPNGKRIAVLRNRVNPKGYTDSFIEIVEVEQPNVPRKVVKLGRNQASQVRWANDTRFLVWMVFDVTKRGHSTEKIVRVISLDDEGGLAAVLFGDRGENLTYVHDLGGIVDMLPDDPNHVLMVALEARHGGLPALYRVDVRDGHAGVLEYGSAGTITWHTQDGVAMLRLDADKHGSGVRMMARAAGERDWKFVRAMRSDQLLSFDIIGATKKPGIFLCRSREAGEDTVSIREIELTGLAVGPPLHKPRGLDATGAWVDARGNLLAYCWSDDRLLYEFIDPAIAPHMAAIEKHVDPELNINLREVDGARRCCLGAAYGPREPGLFFLYDGETQTFTELGRVQPGLTAARLGRTKVMRVRTRDGEEIHAYLTQPASGAPGPLIVMPHGGPEVRDEYDYDPWTQVMAAQGWWVLRPNFRGSGGYGVAFAQAGWKHWGDRMQDDIEDALAQAIAGNRLDPSRVAIVGASYGGYAAQMGAVRRPELYKAAVSIAGVSDLPAMLKWEREQDDTPAKDHYAFWCGRMGDPGVDADLLARASPRRRIAEIRAPMLLIHGDEDDTVPVAQSRDMVKALRAAGKAVEYLELKRAGHSPGTPKADGETLAKVVAFLKPLLA